MPTEKEQSEMTTARNFDKSRHGCYLKLDTLGGSLPPRINKSLQKEMKMEFKEYKSAKYWQKVRNLECAKECLDNCSRAVAILIASALFPILYCIASILDG